MKDPAPCSHPLHIPDPKHSLVSEAVAVINCSRQDVGDSLDAPVRMPRKPRAIRCGIVIAEVVEQKERVEFACCSKPKRTAQVNACAFNRGLRLSDASYWS
jgi:hypothetical protein